MDDYRDFNSNFSNCKLISQHQQLSSTKAIHKETKTLTKKQLKHVNNSQPNGNSTAEKEQQIKDSLGYPVTKEIRDQHDEIILQVGDLITHQAVERAKRANAIKDVLSAVYR